MIDPVPTPQTSMSVEHITMTEPIPTLNTLEPIEPRPMPFSWTFWIFWIFVLAGFIAFYFYYSAKYTANEANYVIKINAKGFKISLDEWKEDIKSWLKKWFQSSNDSLYDKSSQFFFRQHIENGAFVSKQSLKRSPKGKYDEGVNERVDERVDERTENKDKKE